MSRGLREEEQRSFISSEQTIFRFTHTEGITMGTDEAKYGMSSKNYSFFPYSITLMLWQEEKGYLNMFCCETCIKFSEKKS